MEVSTIFVYDLSGRKMEVVARMTGNDDHELDFQPGSSGYIYDRIIRRWS